MEIGFQLDSGFEVALKRRSVVSLIFILIRYLRIENSQ